MTLLGNYLDDHLKVLAYSTSRARTAGDGVEGDLIQIQYELVEGADLPSEVTVRNASLIFLSSNSAAMLEIHRLCANINLVPRVK